jgi:magnesium transporter
MARRNERDRDHPIETAARHLVKDVPTAAPEECAGAVRARLAAHAFECAESLCLIDAAGKLDGLVPLPSLLAAPPARPVGEIALRPAPAVGPEADQEKVASAAIRHRISTMPVVDAEGRLLGVVPALALLDVLRHEHVEDLHRLAGITHERTQARRALEASPLRGLRDRLPWLLIGLLGSSFAALLMARFEETLRTRVTVAFFVPGLVYLADAIGTQTEAIVVRGLSLEHGPVGRLLLGELSTGLLLGLVLGALSALGVWVWLGDGRLALSVGIALAAAGTVATTIGFCFPWALARLGSDPAFGSGPLATVIQDVLSLAVYFATVSVLVG